MTKILDATVDIYPTGEFGKLLKIASAGPHWSGARKKAFDCLVEQLEKYNAAIFHGDCRTYGLQTKGASAVFRIPDGQRGFLSKFKGQLVLIICIDYDVIWSGYSGRLFQALPVTAAGEIITSTHNIKTNEAGLSLEME